MDIRCRKTQCKFNDRYTCKAKTLLIDENDFCQTYQPNSQKDVKDFSKHIFKSKPRFAPQRDTKHMMIACKKNCVLNNDGRCIANGITVNDLSSHPCCMTIVERGKT